MNDQCTKCQAQLLPGSRECPACGLTFEPPTPGVAAAPVTPTPTSASETTRLEQMTQALKCKIEADRVRPTRASRLDEFLAARKGVQIPDSLAAEPQAPTVGVRRVGAFFFGSRRRVAATATWSLVTALMVIFTYNIWDSVFPPHPSSGYDQPTVAQAQAAFANDIPVTPAPAAPQAAAAAPSDLSRFMPPPLPARQAAAPPVQQAAPVQQAYAPPPQQQTAYSPPPSTYAEIPGGQATQPAVPTPDPAAVMQQVNTDYANGLHYYSDAVRRLKDLNGAGMNEDSMFISTYFNDIVRLQGFCSPDDRAKAQAMCDDLGQKSNDIDTAGKSSPTGGQ